MSRAESLVRNTLILSIGTISTKVLTFVMVPFFSRWLSTSDYGEFDLLYTYITLLIPLVTLSCGEAVFRKLLDSNAQKSKSIVSVSLVLTICACLITVVASFFFFSFYNIELFLPFVTLALSEMMNQYFMYYARGKKQLEKYTIAGVIYILAMIIFVTILVRVFSFGLKGMIYGYAIGFALSSLYLVLSTSIVKEIDIRSLNKRTLVEIIKYSAPLIPNSISWWIANVSDRTIVVAVIGSAVNGIYAIANKVPAICTTLFSVFHLSWQENATESINDKDRDIYYSNIFNRILRISLLICSVVIATDPFIFKYILDLKYAEAYLHVPILITAVVFSFMAQFFGGIFIAQQNTKMNGLTTAIAAFVNIIVDLALIHSLHLFAASLSTLISYVVLYVIRYIVVNKTIRIRVMTTNYFYIVVYFCFVAVHYINDSLLNLISLAVACILFCFGNSEYFKAILKKGSEMIQKGKAHE